MAERTGFEPATPGVTGRYSNQLNYRSVAISLLERSESWWVLQGSNLRPTACKAVALPTELNTRYPNSSCVLARRRILPFRDRVSISKPGFAAAFSQSTPGTLHERHSITRIAPLFRHLATPQSSGAQHLGISSPAQSTDSTSYPQAMHRNMPTFHWCLPLIGVS